MSEWSRLKKFIKRAGRDVEKAGKFVFGIDALNMLTGKTAMKQNEKLMAQQAQQAQEQAQAVAKQNADAAFAASRSAEGQAAQRQAAAEAAGAGQGEGAADVDLGEGQTASDLLQRRKKYSGKAALDNSIPIRI